MAYEENYKEIIYPLDFEPESVSSVEDHYGADCEDHLCDEWGDRADWFISEIKGVGTRENSKWCDSCIPSPFVWLWVEWPWTSDEKL